MAKMQKVEHIWFDGKLVPWDEARVHVLTHTLHYGLGVFEGTRAYPQSAGGTAIFRLGDHLTRLERSAHIVQMKLPYSHDELREATLQVVADTGLDGCYVRHVAFIGDGVMGLHPRDNPVRVAIVAWPWGAYLGEEGLRRGVRCKVSSYVRNFPNASMSHAKAAGNYINSILAKREAVSLGYDEAVMLDSTGFVAEGSGQNLFVVRDGAIKTPPTGSILEGLTRDTVLLLAERLGVPVRESAFTRDEMYIADEVFFTGTAAEVTPVREIDDRAIGEGRPGPITSAIQDEFFKLVSGSIPELAHLLTPIGQTARPMAATS